LARPVKEADIQKADEEFSFLISFIHHKISTAPADRAFDSTSIIPRDERLRIIREASAESKDRQEYVAKLAQKAVDSLLKKGHGAIAAELYALSSVSPLQERGTLDQEQADLVRGWLRAIISERLGQKGHKDAAQVRKAIESASLNLRTFSLSAPPPQFWEALGPMQDQRGEAHPESVRKLDLIFSQPMHLREWIFEPLSGLPKRGERMTRMQFSAYQAKVAECRSRIERICGILERIPGEVDYEVRDWMGKPIANLTYFSQADARKSAIDESLSRMEAIASACAKALKHTGIKDRRAAVDAALYVHFRSTDKAIAYSSAGKPARTGNEQLDRWAELPLERIEKMGDRSKLDLSDVAEAMAKTRVRRGEAGSCVGRVKGALSEWVGEPLKKGKDDPEALKEFERRASYVARMQDWTGGNDVIGDDIAKSDDYVGSVRRYGFKPDGSVQMEEFRLAYQVWRTRTDELRAHIGDEEFERRRIEPPPIYVARPKPVPLAMRRAMFGDTKVSEWDGVCVSSRYIVLNPKAMGVDRQGMIDLISHEEGHYFQGRMNGSQIRMRSGRTTLTLAMHGEFNAPYRARGSPKRVYGRWVDEGGNEFSTIADFQKRMAYPEASRIIGLLARVYAFQALGAKESKDMDAKGAAEIRRIRQNPEVQDWTRVQKAVDEYFSEPGLFERVISARSPSEAQGMLRAADTRKRARDKAKARREEAKKRNS